MVRKNTLSPIPYAGATLFYALFLCLSVLNLQAQHSSLKPVTLQLKWTHQFQFAGYYMAQHNGYYREAGLDISDMPVEDDIGLVEGMSIARLIREGMNNIAKHAGASLAQISMKSFEDHVTISICDNGCGFDPASVRRGRGLNNLAKRTAELGGVFKVVSDNGTRLKIVIMRPIRIVENSESTPEEPHK